MAAPKGNQFWKNRSKHGRDKLFANAELLWDAACEYFEWCDEHPWAKTGTKIKGENTEISNEPTARPYTITGLCLYLECNQVYFNHFKTRLPEDEEDFSKVITRIEETIYTQKFEGAAVGAFNANIIARDLGLKDRTESEIKGPIQINITEDDANL
jgi:hypothetical protein